MDWRCYVYKDIVLEAEQTFENERSALSFVAGRLEAYGYKNEGLEARKAIKNLPKEKHWYWD